MNKKTYFRFITKPGQTDCGIELRRPFGFWWPECDSDGVPMLFDSPADGIDYLKQKKGIFKQKNAKLV